LKLSEEANKANMSEDKRIETFIRLRVEGATFEAIADKLEVSNTTLIAWNKNIDTQEAIQAGRQMKIQSILKNHQLDKPSKVNAIAFFSKKIEEELAKRDLSEISTDKLLKMALMNEQRLKDNASSCTFTHHADESIWNFGSSDNKTNFTFNADD